MARDSSGSKNEPQYAGAGAPSTAADLTELGVYAALVGNRKALTNAGRLALTGANRWNGLEVYETDTGRSYVWSGAAWIRSAGADMGVINGTTTITIPDGSTGADIPFQTQDLIRGLTAYLNPSLYGFTVAVAGWYRLSAYALWDSSTAGRRDLQIRVNGTMRYLARDPASASTPAFAQALTAPPVLLAIGDIVTAYGVQTSGAGLGITTRSLSAEEVI